MEKIGNSVKLNNSEKKVLKKPIDRKYGKVTTAIDFESTGGFSDFGIEASIFTRIGKMLNGSRLNLFKFYIVWIKKNIHENNN